MRPGFSADLGLLPAWLLTRSEHWESHLLRPIPSFFSWGMWPILVLAPPPWQSAACVRRALWTTEPKPTPLMDAAGWGWDGDRRGRRAAVQLGWGAGGWLWFGVLGSHNKTQQLLGPCDSRVSALLVCGSCVRSITRETKIREENDKGREREEYRRSRRSKCSWKIKAPNKSQQNSKKANRRSKAREQNAGREVSAKELISQTYESLTLKQKYHSPGSSLWSPLGIMGAMKKPGNKATFIFPLWTQRARPHEDLALCWLRGGAWPLATGVGCEWMGQHSAHFTWKLGGLYRRRSRARTASWDVDL